MKTGEGTALARYAFAVASVAVALLLALRLWPLIQPTIAPIFLAAVMVSAWFAGPGPSLLATILAALAMDYFFLEPVHSILRFADREDPLRLGVFLLVSLLISGLTEARRRAQTAAEEARRFFQAALDSLTARIAIVDRDGRIVAVNEAWRRAGGAGLDTSYLASPEAAGANPAAPAGEVAAGLRDLLQRRRDAFTAEVRRGPEAEPRWLLVRGTRFDSDGPERVVLAHEDVTERKRAEEAQRQAEALRSVARLANAAAHEINNPLATILGNLQLLLPQVDDELARVRLLPAFAAVERIRLIVERMGHMTELRLAEQPGNLPEMLDLHGSNPAEDSRTP